MIENEITFYIDIFYRENKNIFTKNFINFYAENEYEKKYNITIYKLKNYIEELIYDKNFNKTLDNISQSLIKKIVDEIKLKINLIMDNDISLLLSNLNNFSSNLEKILSTKEVINISEEMSTIKNLIQDFDIIIKNQNNRFNFKISKEPLNIMENFVEEDLRPPLILIKDYYNFIENQIMDVISDIVDDFPDCYSLVKNNFIDNRIDDVNNYIKDINETILEYKDVLNNDIENYINKLSFYTFINGLNSPNVPCKQSFCLFNNSRLNSKRRLKIIQNTDNNNNQKSYYNSYNINNKNTSKKEKNWKKNKKIIFRRKLEEYDSSNPSLSEDDVLEYIEDIKKTVLNFDKINLK